MLDYAATSQRQIHRSQLLDRTFAPLFNKLVEFNPETGDIGDIRCDLCTSWELANDGVTYTFHLVDNAKWWDGVPVTADDVVFMFESIVAPDQFEILKDRPTSGNIQVGLYYESGNARTVTATPRKWSPNSPPARSFPPWPWTAPWSKPNTRS